MGVSRSQESKGLIDVQPVRGVLAHHHLYNMGESPAHVLPDVLGHYFDDMHRVHIAQAPEILDLRTIGCASGFLTSLRLFRGCLDLSNLRRRYWKARNCLSARQERKSRSNCTILRYAPIVYSF